MTAEQAIDQSAARDETVYTRYSEALNETLLAECDESYRTDTFVEYFGETEDGNQWSVTLRLPQD